MECRDLDGEFEAGAACGDALEACDVTGLYTAATDDREASCRSWAELWGLGGDEAYEPPVDPGAR